MSELKIVKSSKGKELLSHYGFLYYNDMKSIEKNRYYWGCVDRRDHQCKARITTEKIDGVHKIAKGPSEHVHAAIACALSVHVTNNNIKTDAAATAHHPAAIIIKNIVSCPSESRVHLPNKNAQKAKIRRARVTKTKEPANIDDVTVPEHLRSVDGEQFVLAEKSFNGNFILLLGTVRSIKMLANADCWIMDGTFDVVPSIFRQLYTIFAKTGDATVPAVFCLMTSKSRVCYDESSSS